MYARITTADGDFNVTCDVPQAGAMVAFRLLRYDGEASPGEHCYTVADDHVCAVEQFIAEGLWADSREEPDYAASNNPPGYPGEPPAGVSWESWLAMNNVD